MTKTRVTLITMFFFACLVVWLNVGTAHAASCTPGTDCYCDKVKNASNPIYDPNLLMCEDFEAPTLRLNQGVGNVAPYYGPPYDGGTTSPNDRGRNGYWENTYGNGVNGSLWALGEPPSPKLGAPCGYSLCTGLKIWSVGDIWDANNYQPFVAFLASGEFTQEPHLTEPLNKSGGGAGAFDGTASMFARVPAGISGGIRGTKFFAKSQTFGVTQAVAYASNIITSGLMGSNWKGDEWANNMGSAGGDGLFLFGNVPFGSTFPFYGFTFADNGGTQTTCNTAIAAAIVTTGSLRCDAGGNMIWEASNAQYTQSTDWPLGAWGCPRGYFQNMGGKNAAIQIWFTGPSGVEKKLIDIANLDTTLTFANHTGSPGYLGFAWNAYSNVNQAGSGPPTTEASGRYQDNLHIRSGAPVSCSQIGYAGGTGNTTPPSAPTNLRVN